MIEEIEMQFVNNFVIRSKRERALYELKSPKKRDHVIQQLARFLDDRYIVFCEKKVTDEEFLAEIKKYVDTSDSCYVIGDCSDDGKILRFSDAYNNMMFGAGAYIIVSNDLKTVIKKEEYPTICLPDKSIYHRA